MDDRHSPADPAACSGLSPAKRALLLRRLRERNAAAPEADAIPRRAPGSIVPLSFSQQSMWFLEQLQPGSPTYHRPVVIRLEGPLDRALLLASLRAIVQRHESLRTRFPEVDGVPRQEVVAQLSLELPLRDLSALPPAPRSEALLREISVVARQPFDLASGPWPRLLLFRLEARSHVLLIALHHIVFDGWSGTVLLRELAADYRMLASGEQLDRLPPLAVQYGDFTLWQHNRLRGAVLAGLLEYWKQQLADAPRFELSPDHARPAVPDGQGSEHEWRLPPALTPALKELANRRGVTLFMTLLAGFVLLLHRESASRDISIGVPVAARHRYELEGLIGVFTNSLVLRTRLEGDPTFGELLLQVQEVALGAYAHQELPFERLVANLPLARDLSRHPLFQVTFQLRSTLEQQAQAGELHLQELYLDLGVAKFDLALTAVDGPQGLICRLQYSTELFTAERIVRLADHYTRLLEAVAEDETRSLSALPAAVDDVRARTFAATAHGAAVSPEWGEGERRPRSGIGVVRQFAAAARAHPQQPAVVMEQQVLSYAELDRRTDALARELRALGAGPEVRVALVMERAPEVIVAILGVLKAGAAYVPLEPGLPPARLRFLLEDCAAPLVLTQRRLLSRLPQGAFRSRCVDAPAVPEENAPDQTLPDIAPGQLAYVIYTSGSTGTPNGVMIEHDALAHFCAVAAADYGLGPGDRVLQLASLGFDASVEEIFPALLCGATVVLRSETTIASSRLFVEHCAAWGVTMASLPTDFWHALAADLATEHLALPPSLRLVVIGGEAARGDALALWRRCVGATPRLLNTYGPTETTVVATRYAPPEHVDAGLLPIGRPLANTRVYVLDEQRSPVGVDVAGELYIGGPGVARGYLGRPDLTAERFIADPFLAEPGARLYRSGDLVRWRPDGNLEFLGRIDQQVKIRGYRVELGEIESALRALPGLRDAVVLVQETATATRRLAAWVVAAPGPAPSYDELRTTLGARLPGYMVPEAFYTVPALPLTPNGKVDRRALADCGTALEPGRQGEFLAPRSKLESTLAQIWVEVLGVSRVGVHDDFFRLGGHSLLAVRVLACIARQLGVVVHAQALFEAPTVAALAVLIQGGTAPPELAAIPRRPRRKE